MNKLGTIVLILQLTIVSCDPDNSSFVEKKGMYLTGGGVAVRNHLDFDIYDVKIELRDSEESVLNLLSLRGAAIQLNKGESFHLELNDRKEPIPSSGKISWMDSIRKESPIDFSRLELPNKNQLALRGYLVITLWGQDQIGIEYYQGNSWLIERSPPK